MHLPATSLGTDRVQRAHSAQCGPRAGWCRTLEHSVAILSRASALARRPGLPQVWVGRAGSWPGLRAAANRALTRADDREPVPRLFREPCSRAASGGVWLHGETGRLKETAGQRPFGLIGRAPPAGFEPAHPPPEGGALSPELWGLAQIWTPGCACWPEPEYQEHGSPDTNPICAHD
jgi:hypothetical protein